MAKAKDKTKAKTTKTTKTKKVDKNVAAEEAALEQKKQELLVRAKKDKKLDQRDIFAQIPETPANAELLDSLYTELADMNIEITATDPDTSKISDGWDKEEDEDDEEETNKAAAFLDDDVADDSVRLYLREIGKIPLLSAEEELALAQRIVTNQPKLEKVLTKLSALEDKKDADKRLSRQELAEQAKLEAEAKNLSQPKDQMAEANMRLVVSIAKRYVGRGLDLLDLIQEGNTGLLRAVEKFDPDKGFKFSTYATWWIRQAITRAIADQARTIRIPVH